MKKAIFLFSLLAFCSLKLIIAQDVDPKVEKLFDKSMTISKFLALPDDDFWKYSKPLMYQNQGFGDGHGMYAWPPAMKSFPKKVGLLSFMVFDPGLFEQHTKHFGSYMTLTTTEAGALAASTTQELAKEMLKMSIDDLKKSFTDFGSVLLTPDEFCTADALRNAYSTFDFKEKGLAKLMSGESGANTLAVPEGFSMYYAENMTSPAFVDAVTSKAKELGLDAVLILKIQMGANGETISIQSITSVLYGPNPVPKDPGKKYVAINPATGYHDGVVYNAVKLGAFDTENMLETKEGLNILVFARGKTGEKADFNGFDTLLAKVCSGTLYSFNMWLSGQWKPFKYK